VNIVWVLVMVTAYGAEEFSTESFGAFDTVAACHVAATKIFWENMPINKEAVCLRVEVQGSYWE